MCFFFQAEDGIRDIGVTGVQTCALPIYMLNRKIINTSKNSAFSFTRSFGVVMDDLTKASFWQKPGDDTKYPSIEYADGGYIGQFDGNIDSNIENVSFLRLKQLTISYGLPTKWFKKMGLKECKVYLTGSKIFLQIGRASCRERV